VPPTRAVPPARALPTRALPTRALPAAQSEARAADTPLAPWEQSPEDYAAAPPQAEIDAWPVSSTGPMYVWNPAATGPLNAIDDEEA